MTSLASLVWPGQPPAVPDYVHPLFRILGPLEICPHDPVASPARLEPLQRRLLACCCPARHPLARQALAGALRRAGGCLAARDTIRVTIHRLRLALGSDATRLTCTWGGYQFTAQPAETDAGHGAAAARGRAAGTAGMPPPRPGCWARRPACGARPHWPTCRAPKLSPRIEAGWRASTATC